MPCRLPCPTHPRRSPRPRRCRTLDGGKKDAWLTGLPLSAKSWATNTSTKILATQCFDGATLGTNQTYCWSCHNTNATLGTLEPTVSSDDERVTHRGRRVQRRCWMRPVVGPKTHMNVCRWRGGRGPAPPFDYTRRKGANGPGRSSPLVPVQSRTGTNGGIGPGS